MLRSSLAPVRVAWCPAGCRDDGVSEDLDPKPARRYSHFMPEAKRATVESTPFEFQAESTIQKGL
jgi:hypothetical protein